MKDELIESIKQIEKITDLVTIKTSAISVLDTQVHREKHALKPEKFSALVVSINKQRNAAGVVQVMYNCLLSGEGLSVVGSRYQKRFGD